MKKMMKQLIPAVLAAVLLLAAATVGFAGHHGAHKEQKTGILLVAFGTSDPGAQAALDNIDRKVKAAYPDIPVSWAYTSRIIRHKLAKEGKHLDSPAMALARMADEQFTHVAVQSLHTIGGSEYHDLTRVVRAFKSMGEFDKIILGHPLLATQTSMEKTVDALFDMIPADRKKEDAVVFMGHGTHHPSNAFYPALMFQAQQRDPLVFIGVVEGYPEIDEIHSWLAEKKIKTAWLLPFMSVAGDHAKNDMAGDEEDSWKSILSEAGIDCHTVMKGTAEYDSFVEIWLSHLKDVLHHFD
ncbi:MAG TPA: sirohydrochlorin cobaltochelatase [Desulfotignum sp.]|jgi:sirohydrochlorin cobaltochelatase|nr:sirohydrochlorin cobaltochelatase [Desulfotignum sp.]